MLTFGEIHTGLLQNSTALSSEPVSALLDLVVGERVRRFERPIAHAVSPDQLAGVDCLMPSATRRNTRGIGTVIHRVSVTGGHLAQGSAHVTVTPVQRHGQRLPWSHYLARPGELELLGKADLADVAHGFLDGARRPGALDMGAISGRALDEIQTSALLDRKRPFRSSRTILRWAVLPAPDGTNSATFSIDSRTVRTLLLHVGAQSAGEFTNDDMLAFCADLARHDWLLTTVLSMLDRSIDAPVSRARALAKLHPAVDFLLHLWMPGARIEAALSPLWESLDSRSQLTKQWRAAVDRIRDQLTLNNIALLESAMDAADQAGRFRGGSPPVAS